MSLFLLLLWYSAVLRRGTAGNSRNSRFCGFNSRLGQSKFPIRRATGIHWQAIDSLSHFRSAPVAEPGKSTKFPVTFPSDGNLRLFQPRAIAVDMIGGKREARAVAADDRFEGLVEAPVVGIGGGEALASRRDAVAQPVEIDGEQLAVVDNEPAADHHAGDGGAVLGVDQLVDGIVERQPIRVVEIEHHDVGPLIAAANCAKPRRISGRCAMISCELGRNPIRFLVASKRR
jgi:hypothetical protein